ncbi:MAG: RNA 2',3'-cyclic phosphodiesterase [Candidatus Micrarchaeaceae archaeon]
MRSFIAIEIPEEIKNKIVAVSSAINEQGIAHTSKAAMHITLQFLGEQDERGIESAKAALASVDVEPFDISLRGMGFFEPRFIRIVFINVESADNKIVWAYSKIAAALSRMGVSFDKKEYVPHVTIMRVKKLQNRDALINFIKEHELYDFGSFRVDSISLKKSLLTASGPIYSEIYVKKLV